MSLVAIICDNKRIQPLLPQLLLVNSASVPARIAAAAQKRLPDNVWLLPGKTAWNSHRVLIDLAQVLGRILAPVASQTSSRSPRSKASSASASTKPAYATLTGQCL